MTDKIPSVQDDLAFMRALAQGDGSAFLKHFGQTYFAAGLCYGVQMLLHGGQLAFGWFSTPVTATAIGVGPTVVFLAILVWLLRRQRRSAQAMPVGSVGKAMGVVFQAVGLANLVLVVVIGSAAFRQHSLQTWLIYPCVVVVLQGMAWLVAYTLRRRGWMGLVALGWFATGIAMAFAIDAPAYYISVLGGGFLFFMFIPGLLMMRRPRD